MHSVMDVPAWRVRCDHLAEARVRITLKFFCEKAEQERGFYYHFMDSDTGKRIWKSEASSVDTAWLLCGVLHTRAFWENPEIQKLATEMLDRADTEVVAVCDPNRDSNDYIEWGKNGIRDTIRGLMGQPRWRENETGCPGGREVGREVVDATVGGKLTIFPKVEYESLF